MQIFYLSHIEETKSAIYYVRVPVLINYVLIYEMYFNILIFEPNMGL